MKSTLPTANTSHRTEPPSNSTFSTSKASSSALEKIKPEAVVHAAALTDVDKCELEKELAWKTNVEATTNLAQLCKENDVFLIYVSTDYVFDGEKGMYEETDKPAPINHYGLTKLKGEEAVQTLDNYCIARGSVIYGSTPTTGKTNFALWLLDKLQKKEEVKIATDQWNSPTLNVNMAEMIIEALERRVKGILHTGRSNPPQQIRIRRTHRQNLQPRHKIHNTHTSETHQMGSKKTQRLFTKRKKSRTNTHKQTTKNTRGTRKNEKRNRIENTVPHTMTSSTLTF